MSAGYDIVGEAVIVRIFLAGWQASREKRELEVIKRGNLKWRCFSFANLFKIKGFPYYIKGFEGSYKACVDNGVGIMMDSGIISYRGYKHTMAKKGDVKALAKLPDEETFVQWYVDWVKKNSKDWAFYVTADLKPIASDVLKWHTKLEDQGLRPVPVFHGDVGVEWLKRYVDRGYDYVCIGGSSISRSGKKRDYVQYLDGIFNFGAKHNIKYHGLAMTSPWIMMTWPWFSVDSSWWSRSAGYGSIMKFDPIAERMSILHVSPRHSKSQLSDSHFKNNKIAMQKLREELKFEGFDLDLLRESFTERHVYNSRAMTSMAEHATKRQRGNWNLLF